MALAQEISMRVKLFIFCVVSSATIASGVASAQSVGLYLRGHGGYGGNNASELRPGASEPSLGPILGGEVGANILLFNAYLNHDRYLSRGSVTRAVLGLRTGLGFSGWRLSGRVGAGLMMERDDVFAGAADHTGVVARVGGAFDRRLSAGLWLGVGLEAEYFALKPSGPPPPGVESSVHTGADIFASLRLSFELGL
jgi:hypothetical protein